MLAMQAENAAERDIDQKDVAAGGQIVEVERLLTPDRLPLKTTQTRKRISC